MDPKNIVLLGVKGTVIAFRKDTGQRLWSTQLKSSMSSHFVSVASDESRVVAHTGGELFCLDLQTGARLWHDGLPGMGYGVASVVIPGMPAPGAAPAAEKKRQDEAAAAAASSSAASS